MDKRSSNRAADRHKTEILYRDKVYTGIIENISWSGANVLTNPLDPEINFLPDDPLDLKIESSSGETVIIKCKVIWASKIPPDNVRNRIGMQLMERPTNKIGFFT